MRKKLKIKIKPGHLLLSKFFGLITITATGEKHHKGFMAGKLIYMSYNFIVQKPPCYEIFLIDFQKTLSLDKSNALTQHNSKF